MISGELIVGKDLFNDLAHKPALWPWIFIESAVWLLPFSVLGLFFLSLTERRFKGSLVLKATGVWFAIGLLIVGFYKIFYFPLDWQTAERFPEIAFGWLIPCSFILVAFVVFSMKHFEGER
jgi:hypothetical protein